GNYYYGFVVGLTLAGISFALGQISGGVFNPAVAFSVCTAGMALWADIWIFLLANIAGAALAAMLYLFINGDH
ncbi:MAG: aquaporin, partial [Bacteroidota bacterium]